MRVQQLRRPKGLVQEELHRRQRIPCARFPFRQDYFVLMLQSSTFAAQPLNAVSGPAAASPIDQQRRPVAPV